MNLFTSYCCYLAVIAYIVLQKDLGCLSELVVIEVPGYAKAVIGSYGLRTTFMTIQFLIHLSIVCYTGGTGLSYWAPRRQFYTFRSLYYAQKITNETRFLVHKYI